MTTLRRKADLLLRGIGTDVGDAHPDDSWLDSIDDGAALRLFAAPSLVNVIGGRIMWRKVLDTVPELDKVTKYVDGWESRGRPVMATADLAALWHWTAGRPSEKNPAPSLNICINGRPDVPAPLIHLLVDYVGALYVISSGRANHAGMGHKELLPTRILKGLPPVGSAASQRLKNTGGSGGSLVGIEIEHRGDNSPLTHAQLRTVGLLGRAFTLGLDMDEAQAIRWHHKAWTDRKVDLDDGKLSAMLDQYRSLMTHLPAMTPAPKVLWLMPDGRIVEPVGVGTPTPVRWLPTIVAVQSRLSEGWVQVPAPKGATVTIVT